MYQNEKRPTASNRTLPEEQSVELAKLLIMMKVPKEERIDILTDIETPAELLLFLDKLAEKNFDMTPEEVYQSHLDTIVEIQLANK